MAVELFPTQNKDNVPKCFQHKVHENVCIKCIHFEKCINTAYKAEIKEFIEKNPDLYAKIKQEFVNADHFSEFY